MEYELLTQIISEVLHVDSRKIRPESSFSGDLAADSLEVFHIIVETEKAFACVWDLKEEAFPETVGDLLDRIR